MTAAQEDRAPRPTPVTSFALCLTLFSVAPLPRRWVPDVDVTSARLAVRWLPLLGALLGAVAGGVAVGLHRAGPLVAATVATALLALLTRGLHLDGLADLADGLGSRLPGPEARAVMKKGDVGPFGVVTVVLVLLLDVGCLAAVLGRSSRPDAVLLTAAVLAASRGAVVAAAGAELPPASTGFGAMVAGSQSVPQRLLLGVVAPNAFVGCLDAALSGHVVVAAHVAVTAAPVVAYLTARHAVARLGGITGDVFGAVAEIACATGLLVLAVAL